MLEKTLRALALTGIFALPFLVFIVSTSYFFPFITGKNFAFRILVELITGLWLAIAFVNAEYRPRRSWLFYAITAFVFIMAVADALGVNPAKSFGSNYERMEGWLMLSHLWLFFVVASSLLSEKLWKYWWHTTLLVSVLVGCIGVAQLAGLAEIHQGGVRLDATLGNATYLAIYMYFHIFLAGLFLVRTLEEKGIHMGLLSLYGGIIILDTVILFYTATRGAMLGLVGGIFLASLLYLLENHRGKAARIASIFLGIILILSALFWVGRDSQFIRQSGPLSRIADISLSDNTTKSRLMNAGMALQGFKERPILGWGQEHYAAVFDKYYNPNMWGQEPWFDRTHNVIFDWLVAGGILGLLSYLSLHAAALWILWRSGAFSFSERAIITGLLAGYFFYLLFTFDNLFSYLMFFAVLSYIAARGSSDVPSLFAEGSVPRKYLPAVAGVAICVSLGSVWVVNADAMRANRSLILALSSHPDGYGTNLEYFKKALSYNSLGNQEVREHLSQAAMRLANPDLKVDPAVKKEFVELARSEMQKQIEQSPRNARFPLFLGILLDGHGLLADGKVALEKARELSPNKQSIRFELASNAYNRGQGAEALAILKDAYDLAPEYPMATILYASLLVHSGDIDTASSITKNLTGSEALDQRLLSAYASKQRFDQIAILADQAIKTAPEYAQAYLTKAASLYVLGDHSQAIATLEAMKSVIPASTAQADSLIAQMKAGTFKVN